MAKLIPEISKTKKIGRPSKVYTKEMGDRICHHLSTGKALSTVCKRKTIPSQSVVYRWIREIPEFKEAYLLAKEDSADALADEMLYLADTSCLQPFYDRTGTMVRGEDGKPLMRPDSASVNHARLRVDTRKWIAAKLKPKKYGDALHLGNTDDGPLKITLTTGYVKVGNTIEGERVDNKALENNSLEE